MEGRTDAVKILIIKILIIMSSAVLYYYRM